MKATGIVRRIDDLGRVVIPKEIRRTMRIREGDPLEIYTGGDGDVIFKKYSPIGELSQLAGDYAESMADGTELPVIICDKDNCVAAAGLSKREVLERRLSTELEELMEHRKPYVYSGAGMGFFPLEGVDKTAAVVMPIISSGDVIGAVCLMNGKKNQAPDTADVKIAGIAASFLGGQLES